MKRLIISSLEALSANQAAYLSLVRLLPANLNEVTVVALNEDSGSAGEETLIVQAYMPKLSDSEDAYMNYYEDESGYPTGSGLDSDEDYEDDEEDHECGCGEDDCSCGCGDHHHHHHHHPSERFFRK